MKNKLQDVVNNLHRLKKEIESKRSCDQQTAIQLLSHFSSLTYNPRSPFNLLNDLTEEETTIANGIEKLKIYTTNPTKLDREYFFQGYRAIIWGIKRTIKKLESRLQQTQSISPSI
ncbi:hypothetical protein [Xanthovirga aplysinae]|uniref:hypothetical protein n=1 Tax=Xanthovirga aplysinae TaxID=2529853 RepID=UPI0012BC409E|nr:hypothetical protein [Xanthovirga aplysinae]MTI30653.1 hypothetical protein [Xanthovirga aplysinae]